MKFKLDENLSPSLATPFTDAGHDAHSVVEQALSRRPDEHVIGICQREERVVELMGQESVVGSLWIVEDGRIRIHGAGSRD